MAGKPAPKAPTPAQTIATASKNLKMLGGPAKSKKAPVVKKAKTINPNSGILKQYQKMQKSDMW